MRSLLFVVVLVSVAGCNKEKEGGEAAPNQPATQTTPTETGSGMPSLDAATDSVMPPADSATDSVTAPPLDTTSPPAPDASRNAPAGGAPTPDGAAAETPAAQEEETSLRGVVRLGGSAPTQRLVLEAPGGSTIPLEGDALPALRRAAGTEVVASGTLRGVESFAVSAFTVIAVDGAPALDGVLERVGGTLVLRGTVGRLTSHVKLGNPPRALRDQVGARVWITGDPATGPNAFGVIEPK